MILAPILYSGSVELVVEINPSNFYEEVSGALGTTSTSVTVTVNGLTPSSVTLTTNNGNLGPTSPTSATTTFDYLGLASVLDSQFATVEVIVQDASGNTGTAFLSVVVTRTS